VSLETKGILYFVFGTWQNIVLFLEVKESNRLTTPTSPLPPPQRLCQYRCRLFFNTSYERPKTLYYKIA